MRRLVTFVLGGVLLAAPAAVLGKGHVPVHKIQVCHKGRVLVVSANALGGHQRHGDCQLPACDFANIFQKKDPCPTDCTLANPRDSAAGSTPRHG